MQELIDSGVLWPALGIFLVSALVQGASGFGLALLAVPLLTLLMPPKMAVPATTVASMVVSALIVARLWRYCDWRRAAWLGIPALVTAPFGVHLLKVLTTQQLCLGLGAVLIVSAVVSLLGQRRARVAARLAKVVVIAETAGPAGDVSGGGGAGGGGDGMADVGAVAVEAAVAPPVRMGRVGSVAVGGFSGVLGGALGMTGPLLADYLNKSGIQPDEFRITLNLIFLAASVWRMGLYVAQDVLTGETLWLAAAGVPMAVGGALLGGVLGRRIRREAFAVVINWMLLVIGVGMLFRQG